MKVTLEEKSETTVQTYPVLRKDSQTPCVLLMINREQGIGLVARRAGRENWIVVNVGQIVNILKQSDKKTNTAGFGYGIVEEFEKKWPVIHGTVTIEL
jgi:hypothetical protein